MCATAFCCCSPSLWGSVNTEATVRLLLRHWSIGRERAGFGCEIGLGCPPGCCESRLPVPARAPLCAWIWPAQSQLESRMRPRCVTRACRMPRTSRGLASQTRWAPTLPAQALCQRTARTFSSAWAHSPACQAASPPSSDLSSPSRPARRSSGRFLAPSRPSKVSANFCGRLFWSKCTNAPTRKGTRRWCILWARRSPSSPCLQPRRRCGALRRPRSP